MEFWYQVSTNEGTDVAYDTLVVELLRLSDNARLGTLVTLSNRNRSNVWTKAGPFNVMDYRGQTVRLRFYCRTDFSLPTSFFVDDVALMTR